VSPNASVLPSSSISLTSGTGSASCRRFRSASARDGHDGAATLGVRSSDNFAACYSLASRPASMVAARLAAAARLLVENRIDDAATRRLPPPLGAISGEFVRLSGKRRHARHYMGETRLVSWGSIWPLGSSRRLTKLQQEGVDRAPHVESDLRHAGLETRAIRSDLHSQILNCANWCSMSWTRSWYRHRCLQSRVRAPAQRNSAFFSRSRRRRRRGSDHQESRAPLAALFRNPAAAPARRRPRGKAS
jgi:hypothetical protein